MFGNSLVESYSCQTQSSKYVLLIFIPCPFDEELAIIFVLGILPKDLEPGPGGTVAIEG